MRTRALGQDAPYGAAPRRVLDLVSFDLKQAFFFGYFLLSRGSFNWSMQHPQVLSIKTNP